MSYNLSLTEDNNITTKETFLIEDCEVKKEITLSTSSGIKIHQILPDVFTNDIMYKSGICIKVIKKQTSEVINLIKKHPVANIDTIKIDVQSNGKFNCSEVNQTKVIDLSYLKRVKELNEKENLILCCFKEQENDLKEIKELRSYEIVECKIPISLPCSKEQISHMQSVWPIYIKPNKYTNIIYSHSSNEIATISNLVSEYLINQKEKTIAYCPKTKNIIKASTLKIDKDYPLLSHSFMKIINLQSQICLSNSIEEVFKEDEYYLKDYIILSLIEPCIMCAFALLHSRISKVYFIASNPIHGGLESKIKLSNYESLNHAFEVFKISL